MSPRSLDEWAGQAEILGEGKLLRRALEADRLSSAIFFGPPGCGKSALARLIAQKTRAVVEELNAVTAGVADVRGVIDRAKERRSMDGQKTLLILDEIHRFNRAQQDALLPDVERGLFTLIGLTTENPFFYVNSALLSRAQAFEFKALSSEALEKILDNALQNKERGLGQKPIRLEPDARAHLITQANGDARRVLNALELAALTTATSADGVISISLKVAEECVQKRALTYDKSGDQHYDIASAFIKSLRGGSPDAALYWMARMLAAGDDPRFIARRLIISASEDVGNADPRAMLIAHAALAAVEFVGMPEGRIPLAQAAVYIATAPKSNASYLAVEKALSEVEQGPRREVPNHLKDANLDREALGHGKGYLYPHDFPGHFVAQDYWPQPVTLYEPTSLGYESDIQRRLQLWASQPKPKSAPATSKKEIS
ncbi:MAG: replication-associated recombination protein A [Elusimicrobiota bacterium]